MRRALAARDVSRIGGLVLAIVAISLLHAATNQSEAIWHGLLLRLYYIPILVGCVLVWRLWRTARCTGILGGVRPPSARAKPGGRSGPIRRDRRVPSDRPDRGPAGDRPAARGRTLSDGRGDARAANRELKDSYEQLQRADRLKTLGEVAAGLAHEIRHPLASIRGALEIIDERSRPGQSRSRILASGDGRSATPGQSGLGISPLRAAS